VALRKERPLIDDLNGRAHAGMHQIQGIHDDGAKWVSGGIAVGKPETRHAGQALLLWSRIRIRSNVGGCFISV